MPQSDSSLELRLYRTLWGLDGTYARAAVEAAEAGFHGLEGQVPAAPAAREALGAALANHGLGFIAEITTAGGYVPERHATPEEHLASLDAGLRRSVELGPLLVTCIAGCDAWPEEESRRFFAEALELAAAHGLPVSFETHRSRSLFNPWTTLRLVEALPELELTADFSHWCVVCERLLDSESELIEALAPRVRHVHARVGYDQGPQVPHPAAPEYAGALAAHQRWWQTIWRAQRARGWPLTTMTPEFGPDGYLQARPFSGEPAADLWEVNRWMAEAERAHFTCFLAGT